MKQNWSKKKLTIEEVKSRFAEANMEVLTDVYERAENPLPVRCKNGHQFKYPITKLKTAKCCVICRREGML